MNRITPITVGEKWNNWTIIEEVGYTPSGHLKVKARCECGREKEVYYSKLKRGTSKSCGKCNKLPIEINSVFGRWTVIDYPEKNKYGQNMWLCQCSCGTIKRVEEFKITHGISKSCGCLSAELASIRNKTHGMSHTKIHGEWYHMRERCEPDAECHSRYFDRGIKVCNEWQKSFESFYNYVSNLEHYGEDGYSLDRIDNNGNYEPGNVKWSTTFEQARNKESNLYVFYNGENRLLCELAEEKGVDYFLIWSRLKRGWSPKDAIEIPANGKRA